MIIKKKCKKVGRVVNNAVPMSDLIRQARRAYILYERKQIEENTNETKKGCASQKMYVRDNTKISKRNKTTTYSYHRNWQTEAQQKTKLKAPSYRQPQQFVVQVVIA